MVYHTAIKLMQLAWSTRWWRCAALLGAILCAPLDGRAQESLAQTPDDIPMAAPETPPSDANAAPCDAKSDGNLLIDRLHTRLFRLTCSSASWFDGLFGNSRYQEEYQDTHGALYAGSTWSQRNDFDKVLRFHARLNLPNMRQRLHAFVGRVDRDEYVTESSNELRALPLAFNNSIEDSMLLGLGYNEPLRRRGAFDAGVGARLTWPLDPYVKGSYRYARAVSDRDLLRLRETAFWQNTEGFGVTSRIDWDRVISDDYLLRWTGSATFSETALGVRWYSTATLYQLLSRQRALAVEALARGETRRAAPLIDYGASLIYRQTVLRSWLWIEARAGVDWPREFPFEQRRSNLNAALAFELRYGEHP